VTLWKSAQTTAFVMRANPSFEISIFRKKPLLLTHTCFDREFMGLECIGVGVSARVIN
jgi:hypothetical protein